MSGVGPHPGDISRIHLKLSSAAAGNRRMYRVVAGDRPRCRNVYHEVSGDRPLYACFSGP